jgi:hypothetical protein
VLSEKFFYPGFGAAAVSLGVGLAVVTAGGESMD